MVRQSASLRQHRVGEEVRHALVRVFARGNLNDPALVDANITVTEVDMSPDLGNATVFVTPLGGADLEETVAALNRAAGFLRGLLGREVVLRHTPRLSFAADRSFAHAARIGEILHRPRVRADLASTETAEQEAGSAESDEDGGHGT